MQTSLNDVFWQNRYVTNEKGWDLGTISEPLKAYIDQLTDKNLRILIPGAGNGYEAEYLFRKGFKNVYVVDLAEAPLQNFQKRVPDFPKNQLLQTDFFRLKDSFDLILEQTFFCAIDPDLRQAYAEKCAELLSSKGKLVGLLFDCTFEKEGPPFGGSKAEYQTYFQPYFHLRTFEPAYNSVKPRAGRELFMILEKKADLQI